jgi:hypothetical protein
MFAVFFYLAFFIGTITAKAERIINNDNLKSRTETYLDKSVENGYSASVLLALHLPGI